MPARRRHLRQQRQYNLPPGLSERVNGTDQFVHTDWLGSQRWTSTSSGLGFTNGMRYDAYGQKVWRSAGWHPSNFLYAGEWGYQSEYGTDVEPGLGLMYLEQRYYDPAIGRFISRDPISFAGGLNLYEYCYGDPIGLVDPFGLGPWQWYMEGMGGTSDWVDNRLMGGATARFGTTAGLHDAGCASTGQLLGAGAGWGLQLGMSGGNVAGAPAMARSAVSLGRAGWSFAHTPGAIPGVLAAARPTSGLVRHHTVPREVLGMLPAHVARRVRGVRGAPNRWYIGKTRHLFAHQGAGGGLYNQMFLDRVDAITKVRQITAADVLAIRDELVDLFGMVRGAR